jgi:hypothetical protein
VTPRGDSYGVTATTADQRNEPVTEQVTVPVEPDPLARYGGLAALVVGLVGAVLVAALDFTGRLDVNSETRNAMALARERDSFGEWISTGRVPPVGDDRVVTVDSLTGLVDVAIDSERRVIEDTDSGTFVVLDDATRYEFRPDDGETDVLAPVGGSGTGPAQSNGEASGDDPLAGDGEELPSTDE